MTIDPERLKELLARARAGIEKHKQEVADTLDAMISEQKPAAVDMSAAGISSEQLATEAGEEAAVDVIRDVIDNISKQREQEAVAGKQLGVQRAITLNAKQQQFQDAVLAGKDCCLIGAAGTGKTTCMRSVTRELVSAPGRLPRLREETKWLKYGGYGAAILSYTRKAVNNIRHAVIEELKPHTLTIHKLLEFAPNFYEIEDPANPGEFKKTMVFEPTRNADNPLPSELIFLAFEESSMIGTPLYEMLQQAMQFNPHQEVFLGDIQQLPPVFGSAVLGYKMLQLEVIELTDVYRQALDNPILALAWRILEGDYKAFASKPVETYEVDTGKKKVNRKRWPVLEQWNKEAYGEDGSFIGSLRFQPWQKKLSEDDALNVCAAQFCAWIDSSYYNPDDDMIIIPFNKAFGTIELNKKIMQHLGDKREAIVHEVIAGFNRYYLAVGDRVMYDKEDAFITGISKNANYLGKHPLPASRYLDRWGCQQQPATAGELLEDAVDNSEIDDAALERLMADAVGDDKRVTASSHDVVIRFAYSDEEIVLDKAAEVNNLLGGYAITVHKAQGSEYERGFFVMHNSHAVMNQRELLYTAPTRFKKSLHVICEPDTFEKGIRAQRIAGNTLAEKAEFFKGKHESGADEAAQSLKLGGEFDVSRYLEVDAGSSEQREWQQPATADSADNEQSSAASIVDTGGDVAAVIAEGLDSSVAPSEPAAPAQPEDPIAAMRARLAALRSRH